MPAKPRNAEGESLRVEYAAAQDSAQHHDNLVWTTTGIIWGAGLVLFGFVIQGLSEPTLRLPVVAACVVALFMLLYLWVMALQLGSVRNQKYARCRDIERVLHLKQHTEVHYKRFWGRVLYAVVTMSFIGAWLVVLKAALTP